jgi:hypothetical protein
LITTCDFIVTIFDIGERIDPNSSIKNLPSKSHFLDLDEKEVESVNKGGRKINKHVELWAKNVFDGWKIFHGLDTTR